MTRLRYEVVCGGRHVNDQLQPVGEPCGRTFRHRNPDELHQRARAAGWQIITLPDRSLAVTCPTCRKPDPQLVAICRTLARTPGGQP